MSETIILKCKDHFLPSVVYCILCKKKVCEKCLGEDSNCQDSGHQCISIKKYKDTIISFSKDPKPIEELLQRKNSIEKVLNRQKESVENYEHNLDPQISKKKQIWIQAKVEENKKAKSYLSKMNDMLFILTNAYAKINYFIRKSNDLSKASDIEELYELNNEMTNYFNIIDEGIDFIQKNEQNFQDIKFNSFFLEDGEESKNDDKKKGTVFDKKYASLIKDGNNNSYQNSKIPKLQKMDLHSLSKFGETMNLIPVLFYLSVDTSLYLHLFNLSFFNQTKRFLDYNTSDISDVDATLICNWILVCGGTFEGRALTRTIGVHIKNESSIEEFRLDDLKKPRACSHTLVSSHKYAYCIGGYQSMKDCEKFILEKNQWIDKFPFLNH